MAEIFKFEVTYDELLKLADKAFEDKDAVRFFDCLKRAIALDPSRTEANIRLCEAYAALGCFELSNDVAFRALDRGVDELSRERFFIRLAINFMEMDRPDVAEFYLGEYANDYDFDFPSDERDDDRGLRLVYPHGEEYYEKLVERAYELLRQQRFDDAIKLMDKVDASSPSKEAANHIVLIALMLKNDVDSVIANAENMLKKYGDSLVIKCTLATAYMMEDRAEDARRIVDGLLEKEYTRIEDILLLLPLLVNLELHGEIVKYCRLVLKEHEWQINAMMWLSIALYNTGEKAEAAKVMRQIDTIYGTASPAKYFLQLYETSPEHVEYTISLPHIERVRRMRVLDEIIRTPFKRLKEYLTEDSPKSDEFKEVIEWVMSEELGKPAFVLTQKLSLVMCPYVESVFKRTLLRADVDYELFSEIFLALMDEADYVVRMNVVAWDRYKELSFVKPIIYYNEPEPLFSALRFALVNIVITDDEPNEFIKRLFKVAESVAPLDDDGDPIKTKRLQRICRLKSVRTIVGVLLGKVYEEEESREDIIERYGLNGRTYDKYCNIFYGDGDDGEN